MHYIVTSGSKYTDIDALACAVAMHELLSLQGHEASLLLSAPLNATVTQTIKSWPFNIQSKPPDGKDCGYILVDVSDPEYFDSCVDLSKVVAVYDHHFGFEAYWQGRREQGVRAVIEPVGACATLLWREWKSAKLTDKISALSANLLATAIVSNSLHFKSQQTTKEDQDAFLELSAFCDYSSSWVDDYFAEQDKEKTKEVFGALNSDTKKVIIGNKNFIIGQIEFFSLSGLPENIYHPCIDYLNQFSAYGAHAFVNIVSMEDEKSYICCSNEEDLELIFELFADLAPIARGLVLELHRTILRKDILKRLYLQSGQLH